MRKFLSLLMTLVFAFGLFTATSAQAAEKTVYCKMTQSWWTDGGASVGAYAWTEGQPSNAGWPGVKMTAVEGQVGLWKIDLDLSKYEKVIFTRLKGDGSEDWGAKTKDQTIPTDDKDLFTITTESAVWGDPGCDGTWSKYVPETPAKFYITGDSALIVDAGLDKAKAWNPGAIKSEKDTFELDLKANQDYILKVTVNGTWQGANNVKGYNELSEKTPGLQDISDDHNIGFRLDKAGKVKVVYKAGEPEVFKVLGEFHVEIPAKYYITGDSALVGKDLAWNPAAIKAEKDTTVLSLKAGEYMLKVTLNGTWVGENNVKGFDALTKKAEGLVRGEGDDDDNICFKLEKDGDVKVIYIAGKEEVFELEGAFYVKPVEPIVKKDLALVPGVWASDEAVLAAWTWGAEAEGAWSAFEGKGDTLKAEVNEKADSIIFVRMDPAKEFGWDAEWNRIQDTIDWTSAVFTITDWSKGQWSVYVPEVPAKYYITGDSALVADAAGDATLAWNPKAIKAEQDTVILTLKANQEYNLQVLDGEAWKGYSDLTEKAEGLKAGGEYGNNIIFTLAEAGDVQVIYKAGELFKLVGAFYVDPVEKPKFYVTGNAALVGEELQWNPAAIKSMTDTLVLDLKVDQNYMLKLTLDGEWNEHVLGFDALTEKAEGLTRGEGSDIDNICFSMAEDGKVNVIYFVENEKVTFKLEGKFYVAPVELPKVAIAGAMNDWNENANVMKAAEDGLTASVKINLAADNYDFKVVVDGHWLGRDATYDITRENPKAEGVDKEISYGPNLVLHADAEGEYTFTWTYATNTIVVTFPDAPIIEQPKFYVTGNAALVGEELQWNPAAIKSMTDTLELNLAAGIDYELKVTLNGTWVGENNVKGFNELTEKTEGLKDIGNDHNIGFRLAEAGVVKVIYTAEVFKLIGNFYVEPVEQPKFYVTGNAALVGEELQWNPAAVKSMTDTLTLNLEANVDYELKVTLNGTWVGENNVKGYNELTEKTKGLNDIGNDHNIGFKLNNAGEVKVIYIAAVDGQAEVFKLIGDFHVEPGAGFDNIDASQKAVKLMHNGQVVILRGDKVYTVTGQLIQ